MNCNYNSSEVRRPYKAPRTSEAAREKAARTSKSQERKHPRLRGFRGREKKLQTSDSLGLGERELADGQIGLTIEIRACRLFPATFLEITFETCALNRRYFSLIRSASAVCTFWTCITHSGRCKCTVRRVRTLAPFIYSPPKWNIPSNSGVYQTQRWSVI